MRRVLLGPQIRGGLLLQVINKFGRERHSGLAAYLTVSCSMPTVLRVAGYRFFFFSNERGEAAHIHVEQAERHAKFWLTDVSLAASRGFRSAELGELRRLVFEHRILFQEKWNEHFSR